MRSKRRIASSSASRRFFTLSACATSERRRSRSCNERCSTITARAMSPTSSTRSTPVTSDFQSPRATARTASVILHERAADALPDQQHDAGEQQYRGDGGHDQPNGERAAFRLADADQLVAQRMEFGRRRERAGAPMGEQGFATRPVLAVRGLQQRRIRDLGDARRVRADTGYRNRILAGDHEDARAFQPGELLQHVLARTQCAMRNEAGEHVAEIVEDRLGDDEGHRRGLFGA